jgi:hypothetical protein
MIGYLQSKIAFFGAEYLERCEARALARPYPGSGSTRLRGGGEPPLARGVPAQVVRHEPVQALSASLAEHVGGEENCGTQKTTRKMFVAA